MRNFLFSFTIFFFTSNFQAINYPSLSPDDYNSLSPNSCFIIAEIYNVLRPNKNSDFPCNKTSCEVNIKILKVKKCGSSVLKKPFTSQIIKVSFPFTVKKSKKYFPKKTEIHAALKRKDIIEGIVSIKEIIGGELSYTINKYQIKNTK